MYSHLARWVLALQDYDFSWEYINGSDNIVADALSRMDLEGNKTDRDVMERNCQVGLRR